MVNEPPNKVKQTTGSSNSKQRNNLIVAFIISFAAAVAFHFCLLFFSGPAKDFVLAMFTDIEQRELELTQQKEAIELRENDLVTKEGEIQHQKAELEDQESRLQEKWDSFNKTNAEFEAYYFNMDAHSYLREVQFGPVMQYHRFRPDEGFISIDSAHIYSASIQPHFGAMQAYLSNPLLEHNVRPSFILVMQQLEFLDHAVNLFTLESWYKNNQSLDLAMGSGAINGTEYLPKKDFDLIIDKIESCEQRYLELYGSDLEEMRKAVVPALSLKIEVLALRYYSVKDTIERKRIYSLIRAEIIKLGVNIEKLNMPNHILLKPFANEFNIASVKIKTLAV